MESYIVISIVVVVIVWMFINERYETLSAIDKNFENLENKITNIDPSQDVVYVSAHETDQYVHLWQIEPGLNNKEIAYIGRFQKYVMGEYIELIKGFAGNKTVEMFIKNPTVELQNMGISAYQLSVRGEI